MADVSLLFPLARLARFSNVIVHEGMECQPNVESVQNAVACGENKEIRPCFNIRRFKLHPRFGVIVGPRDSIQFLNV